MSGSREAKPPRQRSLSESDGEAMEKVWRPLDAMEAKSRFASLWKTSGLAEATMGAASEDTMRPLHTELSLEVRPVRTARFENEESFAVKRALASKECIETPKSSGSGSVASIPASLKKDELVAGQESAEAGQSSTDARPRGTVQFERTDNLSAGLSPQEQFLLQEQQRCEGDLEFLQVLGEGGMGVVHLAQQISLQRQVAVKSLRNRRDTSARQVLLREAWLTGVLEHPNIVPLYGLNRGIDGELQIVMKRISGTAWKEFLHDGDEVEHPGFPEESGRLDWHLRIFVQVCNAVHYAHSRGILHRDLKPENVMIGEFGEVYVLDWGIAVSMREDDAGRLPLARESKRVVGTPAYMAPEMVCPQPSALDVRTDVYLLGAVLHEIVMGEPPHLTTDIYQSLFRAFTSSAYDYPSEVPEGLAAICQRAMHRDPDARYPSVRGLQQAVSDFLQHHSSTKLTQSSLSRLAQLQVSRDAATGETQPEQLHKTFAEARFGFQQAIDIWPENQAARDGLQQSLLWMIRYELKRDNHSAARLLWSELPLPDASLLEVIEGKRLKEEEQRLLQAEVKRNFDKIQHDHDPNVARASRSKVALALGVVWCLLPILYQWGEWQSLYQMSRLHYILTTGLLAMVMGATIHFVPESLTNSKLNQRILGMLVLCLAALFLNRTVGLLMDLPIRQIVAFDMLVGAMVVSSIAVAFELRLLLSALPYIVGFVVAAILPHTAYIVIGIANFLALGYMAWVWDAYNLSLLLKEPDLRR